MNELQQRIFSQEIEDAPGARSDRRREPRTHMDRPVYVEPVGHSYAPFEEVRTMTNFSRNGFYFITQRKDYCEGMQLYVIPAFGCFNFEYIGIVVRVEELPFGDYGIAVKLLHIGRSAMKDCTATRAAFQSFSRVGNDPTVSSSELEPAGCTSGRSYD